MPDELWIRNYVGRVYRVVRWKGRIATYLKPHYCGACERINLCNRLRTNEIIMAMLLRGEDCPDFRSVLDRIWQ